MRNDKIARWAFYTYLIILFSGMLNDFYVDDALKTVDLLRPEAFNVGYKGMDVRAIQGQISDAFDQIITRLFYYPFFIWLCGFHLLKKYYRAQRGSLISTLVLVIPLLLFITNLIQGAIACHSLIENKISMIAPQWITDIGYRNIKDEVIISSVAYFISTAIMAIFYRRKG